MHMADALLSPAVGGSMWAATAACIAYASKKVRQRLDDRAIPMMGVLGAFIFAAQMINFTIPGTGSSGHLGGGMILAVLLGPHAAFLVMASILTVQALFFADGGLLALGCNIFNLGFFPCYLAYPLLYRGIAGPRPSRGRITAGSLAGAVFGLQLGAAAVVLETVLSGISELPFRSFVLAMLPIHLAIGLVEGLVTAAVINFVRAAEPGLAGEVGAGTDRRVLLALLTAALITGGILSWFASERPDGLEWAMGRVSGHEELAAPTGGIHELVSGIQERLAPLPDYGFKAEAPAESEPEAAAAPDSPVSPGTSVSGLVGGILTLAIVAGLGFLLRRRGSQLGPARSAGRLSR
ncbi:MAG: energy-coupling factor ABC transporter permease [Thermodesulfobacteriota bacterium]